MKTSLHLTGDHPFAAWLAVYLSHRGWPLIWQEPRQLPEPDGWIGISYDLFQPLGEPVPVWPVEFCAQQLEGICLRSDLDPDGFELKSWPAAVLSVREFWQELAPELQLLKALDPESLDPAVDQISWYLDIGFGACEGKCRQIGLSSILPGVYTPGGLLETWQGSQDQLALAIIGPGQTAFSYRLDPESDNLFWQRLSQALDIELIASELEFSAVCLCVPELLIQEDQTQGHKRTLTIRVAEPTLSPDSFVQQGLLWLMVQTLGRWLGDELTHLDRLGLDLASYREKMIRLLSSLVKSQNFLQIRL